MSSTTEYRRGVVAEGDLTAVRYQVVKKGTADDQVLLVTAITDASAGVLQNEPGDGEVARVAFSGPIQVKYGAAVTHNDRLAFNASGKAIVAVAGQLSFAVAERSGALDEVHTVNCDFTNQIVA